MMNFKKKYCLAIYIVLMVFVAPVFANTNDIINAAMVKRDEILKSKHSDIEGLKHVSTTLLKSQNNQKSLQIATASREQVIPINQIKLAPRLIIFASLGMPDVAIKQFMNDGAHYHAAVVLRGLWNNSFKETIDKIYNLIKDDNKGGLLINPIWFKKFNIQSVPAFVIQSGDKYDILYGNIPFRRVLKIVSEQGETAEVAKSVLREVDHETF